MTYQDVLNELFNLLNSHKMIKTVGYGPLSELLVPKDDYNTDYPYAFLLPTNHTLSKGKTTMRFTLIMMEMCEDDVDSVIKAQSDCYQYIKDVLGHLYYHYDQRYDFNLNVNVTPFKEKYNDVVSGMSAQIEFEIRDTLDDCITPFN